MRMRGMPSICVTAQRVCGARAANIRLVESFFRNAREKVEAAFDISMTRRVFSETRSVVGLSKGTANRITIRIGESIFMRRAHTPTIATDGRYLFPKSRFVLTQYEMRYEKTKRPRESF